MAAAERIAVQPPQARHETGQKANDLARAAVGCNGGLGGWPPTLACCPHARTTLARNHAGTTGVWSGSRAAYDHAQHHGHRHDGPSNHASTTGTGTTESARRAFQNRARLVEIKNGLSTTLPQPPNGLAFSCRERAA
jgi:hypothetical protein